MKIKRKRCVTAARKKLKLWVLTALVLALAVTAGWFYRRYAEGYAVFDPPAHEATALPGTPAEDAAGTWAVLPVAEGYAVGLSTVPRYADGRLYVNACSDGENTVWFLVRVYEKGGEEPIGASGVLYPGEYVESIPLAAPVEEGQELVIKTVAYTPEEYHSEGVATIACRVAKTQPAETESPIEGG